MRKRVLSGIQPTGNIHIGNYLAAVQNWVLRQDEFENIFCIVDLHAITIYQDPRILKRQIRQLAALLIASGIDPQKSFVFVQSQVSAHAQLAWILNCFTPMGWLNRMTQFKEKSKECKNEVSTGLFDYPVLMAADILLYETDLVPVGEDQKQHVEFARDIAKRFNSIYGPTFKIPEVLIPEVGARIMGLDEPTKKMSKSKERFGHAIYLLDSPDQIRAKIMAAVTDSGRDIHFDQSRPGIYNLLVIYELFTKYPRPDIERRFEGKGYVALKKELIEVIIEHLRPLQSRYQKLMEDSGQIDSILQKGAVAVRPITEKTLAAVKEKVGLW
ncbi:MAG: tryptophan--tRNA ligase [Candidatus Omnitrophica bacterium]|nr:tryptophan--tRNA ligase [Candidatus Omnitrophota bacterium]